VCAAAATRLKTRAVIPEAVPPLTAMLDEDDQQVVFQALETLVYYVHGNNLALDTIDPVLRCADPTRFADNTSLKNKVALILGAAGDPRGAPGLVYIMGCRGNRGRPKDKHHPAAYALRALERIGAEQVTPELIPLLSHEDIVIRHNAAYALGILKAADALDALQALAEHDDNGGVRGVAMTAIRRIKRR
jgi:HEAT repeat protein